MSKVNKNFVTLKEQAQGKKQKQEIGRALKKILKSLKILQKNPKSQMGKKKLTEALKNLEDKLSAKVKIRKNTKSPQTENIMKKISTKLTQLNKKGITLKVKGQALTKILRKDIAKLRENLGITKMKNYPTTQLRSKETKLQINSTNPIKKPAFNRNNYPTNGNISSTLPRIYSSTSRLPFNPATLKKSIATRLLMGHQQFTIPSFHKGQGFEQPGFLTPSPIEEIQTKVKHLVNAVNTEFRVNRHHSDVMVVPVSGFELPQGMAPMPLADLKFD
jgi:hypothetical protein